ncbi:MAG: sulfatase [Acidobacteriota bacterium]
MVNPQRSIARALPFINAMPWLRKLLAPLLALSLVTGFGCSATQPAESATSPNTKPNVLFIVLDDANDWIEPFGGHPDARTPNFRRLAERSTLFEAAYADAPACNPSRTAVLTGRAPHSSGVYYNGQPFRAALPRTRTLPQAFQRAGYQLYGAGKVYHGAREERQAWDLWFRPRVGKRPQPAQLPAHGIEGLAEHVDWGTMVSGRGRDPALTGWAARQLRQGALEEPFFLAIGLHRPHMPWYLPQKHWDLFPADEIQLPNDDPEDLEDLPAAAQRSTERDVYEAIDAAQRQPQAVSAYLAALHYADEHLGTLLDGLDDSSYGERTIIVLWSDHGFHLGEKRRFGKYSLWREATRVPLLLAGPGLPSGRRVQQPVQLTDLYPTLTELCGIEAPKRLDGRSLLPLLRDPGEEPVRRRPALSTHGPGHHSLHWRHWSYIRYADGSEELYDLRRDEAQLRNLAAQPTEAVEEVLHRLRSNLPAKVAPPSPTYEEVGFEPRELRPGIQPE